jgi:hypothetical protein
MRPVRLRIVILGQNSHFKSGYLPTFAAFSAKSHIRRVFAGLLLIKNSFPAFHKRHFKRKWKK